MGPSRSPPGHGPPVVLAMSMLSVLALMISGAVAQDPATSQYQVHAGGSAQAGTFIRKAMSTLQARSRAPIQATYREIGTVQAQIEFGLFAESVANSNNFKVGDIPLQQDQYNNFTFQGRKMLHLPLAIGSVSVFYNQQVPAFGLELDACTIDGIYQGKITKWSDGPIADFNNWGDLTPVTDPSAAAPAPPTNQARAADVANSLPYLNATIIAFGYKGKNSAAYTLSEWVEKACSETTTVGELTPYNTSLIVQRSYTKTDSTGNVVTKDILTAEDMAEAIALTQNSIGFLATNIGVQMDLDEANLQNAQDFRVTASGKNQKYLTMTVKDRYPPNTAIDFTSDVWPTVQFADQQSYYPMTTLIYAYIAQDLTPFPDHGTLTKALLTYMFSDEGQALVNSTGLVTLPPVLFEAAKAAVGTLLIGNDTWIQEAAIAPTSAGMQIRSFSELRTSGTLDELNQLSTNVSRLQERVSTGVVVRAAGSAYGNSGSIFRGMMDDLESYASYAVRFLYEDVSVGVETMSRLLHPNQNDVQTRLLVLDQPLTTDQWTEAGKAGVQVLQHPLMIRPIAILYSTGANSSVPGADTIPNLGMSPCNLARILKGTITKWNDLGGDNGGLNLPGNDIKIYAACNGLYCGTMNAVLAYVQSACPSEAPSITAPIIADYRGDDLATLIVNGPPGTAAGTNVSYTALVFADANWAVDYAPFGVKEAAIPGVGQSNGWVTASKMTPESFSDLLRVRLGEDSDSYPYAWSDWSQPLFNLFDTSKYGGLTGTSYPLARMDFTAVPADLNELGDAGGALQGVMQYAYDMWQSSSNLNNSFPAAAPLPAQARFWAAANLNILTRISILSPPWPVVATSLDAPAGSRPYVMSYLPSGGAGTVDVAAFNQFKVSSLAAATAQLAVAKSALASASADNSASLASYTYGVAIAALVLVLILAVAALVIALLALRDARRALTLMSGGAGKSYSFQVNGATNANAAAAVANTPSYPSSSTIVSPARAKANPLFGCLPGAAPATKYEVFGDKGNNGHVGIEMEGAYKPAPKN